MLRRIEGIEKHVNNLAAVIKCPKDDNNLISLLSMKYAEKDFVIGCLKDKEEALEI